MLTAGEVMQRSVLSVAPESTLVEVHRLFIEEEINGAPVIDQNGRLRGLVSSLDLLRAVREAYEVDAGATTQSYLREELEFSGPDWQRLPEDFQDHMARLTAADAMVPAAEVITVRPEASIAEVAALMIRQRIHRVLVIEEGLVTGLVSTFDLIGVLARGGEEEERAGAP